MGVEVFNKTLGVIGCGNIGSIVADRARPEDEGDRLRSLPVAERAIELGVEKVELDELFKPRRLHHAAHAAYRKTRNIVDAAALKPR